jgi:hypothetical protein
MPNVLPTDLLICSQPGLCLLPLPSPLRVLLGGCSARGDGKALPAAVWAALRQLSVAVLRGENPRTLAPLAQRPQVAFRSTCKEARRLFTLVASSVILKDVPPAAYLSMRRSRPILESLRILSAALP